MTHVFGIAPNGETWVADIELGDLFFDGPTTNVRMERAVGGTFVIHYQPQVLGENGPARAIVAGLTGVHIQLTGIVYLTGLGEGEVAEIVIERAGNSD